MKLTRYSMFEADVKLIFSINAAFCLGSLSRNVDKG